MRGVHDQLFKELSMAFPGETVALLMPDLAARLELSRLRFDSPECFIDSRTGWRRFPDLVSPAFSCFDPDDESLLHLEIEYRYRGASVARLHEYNRVLSLAYGMTVHTGVLYVRGGPAGWKLKELREESLGRCPTVFTYDSLGLSRASAEAYLARPEKLAWAYASLMRPGGLGSRAELALACLRRIAEAQDVDDYRRFLLLNCVRTYVESDERVAREYASLLRRPPYQEVHEMMMTWADELKAEGRQEGRREGRQEGRREGRREGRKAGRQEGMQDLIVRLLTRRFGPLPARVQQRIAAIRSVRRLQSLAEQVLQIDSLQELAFD